LPGKHGWRGKSGDGNLGLQAKIGLLPDVPAFYDWMTGRDFMQFVGELHSLTPDDIKKNARTNWLELVELKKAGQPACRRILTRDAPAPWASHRP